MAEQIAKRKTWMRRLFRNQTGSVMMEYIVVGLLIAAVSIAAVRMFGGSISDMFRSLTTAVVSPNDVGTKVGTAQTNADTADAKVDAHVTAITGGGTSTTP